MRFGRVLKVGLVVAVLVGAGVGGWYAWRAGHIKQATGVLTLYGNVDLREVQLAFNASDRITKLTAKEGDRVKKGEPVGELDQVLSEQAVKQAAGQLAAQRAVVNRLTAGSRPQEIAKARADVAAAKAAAKDAALTWEQTKELFTRHAATARELDHAKAARDQSAAQAKSLQEVLRLAVLGPRQEDLDQAKAVFAADKAGLALAKQRLKDTKLFAPADGVIRNRLLEVGDMASPGTPVYTLALTRPVWVRAYVDEADLGKLKLGMTAQVTTDSYPGKRYAGRIGFISPTAEFTPKNVETAQLRTSLVYEVRVYVDKPEGDLRLGMPATVKVDVGPKNIKPPRLTEQHG